MRVESHRVVVVVSFARWRHHARRRQVIAAALSP